MFKNTTTLTLFWWRLNLSVQVFDLRIALLFKPIETRIIVAMTFTVLGIRCFEEIITAHVSSKKEESNNICIVITDFPFINIVSANFMEDMWQNGKFNM